MLLPNQIDSNITLPHAVPATFESVFWSLNLIYFLPFAFNDALSSDFFDIQNALESDFINKNALESEFSNKNKAFEIEIPKKKDGFSRFFPNLLSTLFLYKIHVLQKMWHFAHPQNSR